MLPVVKYVHAVYWIREIAIKEVMYILIPEIDMKEVIYLCIRRATVLRSDKKQIFILVIAVKTFEALMKGWVNS
jgi:hypothetical protein